MDDVRTIDAGGNRVVRLGRYSLDNNDGEEPEARVFLAAGWASQPPLPFGPELVDIPADALPSLLEALRGLEGEL